MAGGRKPVAAAVRMDERLLDPDGDEAWVSLVLLARDRSPLFDDPAVSGALRAVLAGPPPDGVSTFVRDSSHFAGAVTVRRQRPEELADDPFARFAHADVLHVGAGVVRSDASGAGSGDPAVQREALARRGILTVAGWRSSADWRRRPSSPRPPSARRGRPGWCRRRRCSRG